jgi:hypothetical protein
MMPWEEVHNLPRRSIVAWGQPTFKGRVNVNATEERAKRIKSMSIVTHLATKQMSSIKGGVMLTSKRSGVSWW